MIRVLSSITYRRNYRGWMVTMADTPCENNASSEYEALSEYTAPGWEETRQFKGCNLPTPAKIAQAVGCYLAPSIKVRIINGTDITTVVPDTWNGAAIVGKATAGAAADEQPAEIEPDSSDSDSDLEAFYAKADDDYREYCALMASTTDDDYADFHFVDFVPGTSRWAYPDGDELVRDGDTDICMTCGLSAPCPYRQYEADCASAASSCLCE